MDFSQLMEYILSLPASQKKMIIEMLNEAGGVHYDEMYDTRTLTKTPEWQEMIHRAEEVIFEEKSCLIHFDDHIQSLN